MLPFGRKGTCTIQKGTVDIKPQKELASLIEEARDGKTEAFREIFNQFSDRLYAYAVSRTASKDDALDAVQDAFVDLWGGLQKFQYRSDEEFGGFVFKILKRKISRQHRLRRGDISLEDMNVEESYEIEVEDYRFVANNVDSLSPKYQEVVRLRYWGQMSFGEIASTLNIKEGAAKVRHHRAIEKLKENLNE